jgi:hypothetical protein
VESSGSSTPDHILAPNKENSLMYIFSNEEGGGFYTGARPNEFSIHKIFFFIGQHRIESRANAERKTTHISKFPKQLEYNN